MKRSIKAILIFTIILTFTLVPVYADSTGIKIDGTSIIFNGESGYPFVENGRTMVPLRVTMEAFGANVTWNQGEKAAYVEKDGVTVKSVIGENFVTRNGQIIKNDAAAVIRNNKTYLPIRVVLESFGAVVGWDNTNKTVTVNSQNSSGIVFAIENTSKKSSNFWKDWTDALSLKESGNYSQAIDKFTSVVPAFLQENNSTNMALLFKHIGDCYVNLKEYDKAAACWVREGYYWSKDNNRTQETIAANRKADFVESEVRLYSKTTDATKSRIDYFGAPLEPAKGIITGAYAEGDPAVHDFSSMEKFYINEFPKLIGKDHSAYLIYFTYGLDLSVYNSHFEVAKAKDKVIELALEPMKGLDEVNNSDGYLIKLAKDMEKSGCKFILRFASEMNDKTGNPWYTSDYNKYIEKFRLVSNTFKEYAPSVGIVWAPNFFPPDTIPYYYPGDEYVDYVGISSYQNYAPDLDPLKQGIDRARWSSQLDHIYSLYGHKKPIIITEGGSSFKQRDTGKDISDYAAKQIKDFYTYLPIKYPNVKGVFIYDSDTGNTNYVLSQNNALLNAYSNAIKNEYYLTNYRDTSGVNNYYYELANNSKASPTSQELNAYIKYTEEFNITRVDYLINDSIIGSAYDIPYGVNCDLSNYSGKEVNITVKVYGTNSQLLLTREFKVQVE